VPIRQNEADFPDDILVVYLVKEVIDPARRRLLERVLYEVDIYYFITYEYLIFSDLIWLTQWFPRSPHIFKWFIDLIRSELFIENIRCVRIDEKSAFDSIEISIGSLQQTYHHHHYEVPPRCRRLLSRYNSNVSKLVYILTRIWPLPYSVEHYPSEDEKLRASSIVRRRDGNSPNTLEVLQQLLDFNRLKPVSLILSAALPSSSSPEAQQIKFSFEPTVDLTHCVYRENCNESASSYIIRSRSTDSRTLINYNELPKLTSNEFNAIADELRNETSWCHFEASRTSFLH